MYFVSINGKQLGLLLVQMCNPACYGFKQEKLVVNTIYGYFKSLKYQSFNYG